MFGLGLPRRLLDRRRSSTRVGKWLLAMLLPIVLAGCALSPQTVTLTPLVDVGMPFTGHGRALELTVTDDRGQTVIGSRGGIYGDTALLTPRTDIAQTLRQALAERLSAAGFQVRPAQTTAPASLNVSLRQLHYQIGNPAGPAGSLLNDVRVEAVLEATARRDEQSRSAQYRASSVRRVLGYPSEADNEAMINESVDQTLRQLLQDPALLQLLAG